MFQVRCNGCGAQAFVDCTCPPEMAAVPAHVADCPMTDMGANVVCPPGSGCCQESHSHDAAANACPGGHDGAACPVGTACFVFTPPGEPCPGGHCALGVPGCTVCRPVTITGLPGSASRRPLASLQRAEV